MNSIDIKHEKFYYYRNSLDTLIPFTLNTVHNQTNVMPKNNNSLQLMMASWYPYFNHGFLFYLYNLSFTGLFDSKVREWEKICKYPGGGKETMGMIFLSSSLMKPPFPQKQNYI